ncbi:selenocysteine insertion sequence-binding protein 2-like isoform X2 [Solea solea]|uniref:selenocysteine insertion sequence-binding protein 2-like isoform X2 n=1 Tax=Solea solea TaxID=90069 RepID=UPI00272D2EB9|nr:selenocysteine insertion sequence-binding protein 2-like isoform X2 [Solea solea]
MEKKNFDSKHQRRPMKASADSPHLISPNPHISQQISTEKHSGPKALRKEGDTVRSHSYSGSCRAGESTDDFLQRERASAPKAAKSSTTARAQRSCVQFEVKMCDFPELSGGSVSPPSAGQKERMSVTRRSPTPQDPQQSCPKPRPPAVSAGQTVVTSWANVASQPAKKPLPQETTNRGSSSLQSGETLNRHHDDTTAKKKRRKKKKKSKEGEEEEETLVYQEPPKFEDEDEFPGLMSSRCSANICTQEKQRDRGPQLSTQDKAPVSMETLKKGQKTEKVSGKKSKALVQLDIGNVFAVLEKKQSHKDKAVVLSVGGGLPVVHKLPSSLQKKPEKFAHNPLDSTCPLVKKGKQREVPKVKKPTALKKVILKEREERKQQRLLEERGDTGEGGEERGDTGEGGEERGDTGEGGEERGDTGEGGEERGDTGEEKRGDTNITEEVVSPCEEAEDQTNEEETRSHDCCCVSTVNIHSRRFRDYCSQMLSRDVDDCVVALLKELVRFQDRLYQKDPMKARMKRRVVMGLREVLKHLRLRKVKCVIISPNCERVQSKGGLDEALYTIIDTCREQEIPFVFALSRKALGRCVNKAVPVSVVGVFNYDGAQDHYHKMIELSSEARGAYDVMVSSLEQKNHAEEAELHISCQAEEAEEAEPCADSTHPEEPEYIKLWRKMLVKEKNQVALASLCLPENEDCDKNTEEEES